MGGEMSTAPPPMAEPATREPPSLQQQTQQRDTINSASRASPPKSTQASNAPLNEDKTSSHLDRASRMVEEVKNEQKSGYVAQMDRPGGSSSKKKEDDLIDTYGDDFEEDIEEDI